MDLRWNDPHRIFEEYERGVRYKTGLGEKGMYRQNELNRRFFSGDQWHGAKCGGERPLVRHNLLRRIGDYKMAAVGGSPVAVNYSADGVPSTAFLRERAHAHRRAFASGEIPVLDRTDEVVLVTGALSDYFTVTAERVGFDELRRRVLLNAYTTGTGVLYTYWDDRVRTGQYADEAHTMPITGDVACEVLDIENVYFGDPTVADVQAQPFILITARKPLSELRRMAKRYGRSRDEIASIKPDREFAVEDEAEGKALLVTKLFKEYDEAGDEHVYGVQVCRGVTIRAKWELGVRLYPLSVFRWDDTAASAYGESEITSLIPNQIAVNRLLTSSVWAMLMQGLPTMVVNGDVVAGPVTNDPGQVIRVFGSGDDVRGAISYVDPPHFSSALSSEIQLLIQNTLSQSGANAVSLGDVDPDNTSAIVAVREAAMMPLGTLQGRFYTFIEQVARLWAEFWVTNYGVRAIAVNDTFGTWYLPFDGARYRDLLLRVKVDVGAASLWSESQSIVTLDNLLTRGVITPVQYLKRLPHGIVPDVDGLLREMEGVSV